VSVNNVADGLHVQPHPACAVSSLAASRLFRTMERQSSLGHHVLQACPRCSRHARRTRGRPATGYTVSMTYRHDGQRGGLQVFQQWGGVTGKQPPSITSGHRRAGLFHRPWHHLISLPAVLHKHRPDAQSLLKAAFVLP
jgi:hypothetical protein